MKQLLMIICFIFFCTPSVLKAQKCYDYTCNISKAKAALSQKHFKEALAYCKAAKAYPNADIATADALIDKVFEGIEAQKQLAIDEKKRAEEATIEAMKASRAEKKSAAAALKATEVATKEAENAQREKQRAEKTARAAENSAVFMKVRSKDSTLALRMMQYNYLRHPENKFTRDIYQQTVNNPDAVFYLNRLRGQTAAVDGIAFSPDGTKIVAHYTDGKTMLWDMAHKAKAIVVQYNGGSNHAVVFSPDGKKILIGSRNGMAVLCDVETGQVEKRFLSDSHIFAVAFSPDGNKILTAHNKGLTFLWDIATEKIEKCFIGNTSYVFDVIFSPDGKKIVTANSDRLIRLWDVTSEKVIKLFVGNTNDVNAIAFSPDGKKLLTSTRVGIVQLWDVTNGKAEKTFIKHTSDVLRVAFSPDGKKVLTGSRDGTAQLWDIQKKELDKVLIGHVHDISAIAFSLDGKKIVTGDKEGSIMLWDAMVEKTNNSFISDKNSVSAVAFSPDGKSFVTGGSDPIVKLWDSQSGKMVKTFVGHQDYVGAVAFSSDSKKIATCSRDNTVKIWDITTAKPEQSLLWDVETDIAKKAHSRNISLSVTAVAFSPDDKMILTSSGNKTAQLWDIESGKVIQTFVGHDDFVTAVAFSPDGKWVLTGSRDNTAKLWACETGQVLKTFGKYSNFITAVAFSPNGKKIVITSYDKSAHLWDIASGEVEKNFIGHEFEIKAVAFSPDGQKIVTASYDKTIKLWDVASERAEKTFIGHTDVVNAIGFSPDGKKCVTGSSDNTIRIWDTEKDAIEDKVYSFSLYEMAQEGLLIEPQDTPQYWRDSITYAEQTAEHERLVEEASDTISSKRWAVWRNSVDYKQYYTLIDSLMKIAKANEQAEKALMNADREAAQKQAAIEKEKIDPIGFLQDKARQETDSVKLYNLLGILIDSFRHRWQQAPEDYASNLGEAYLERAWLGFFLKKFKQSEQDIRAGVTADSTNILIQTNLAPALLMQGKFNEAKEEYEKWKDKVLNVNGFDTYREAFLDDLNTFEEAGIIPKERAQDVKAIRKLLEKKE